MISLEYKIGFSTNFKLNLAVVSIVKYSNIFCKIRMQIGRVYYKEILLVLNAINYIIRNESMLEDKEHEFKWHSW